ncbi:MAG: transposase [Gemmatimonadetes bacterium]|nr:transposase [Gemmatimonadota bacterium]
MNTLPKDKQIQAVSALTEGCSIRATERLTDIHRDTIMRLGVRVGQGCEKLHDRLMLGLQVPLIELDEIWAYVGKKQRKATPGTDEGDQYTFIALDAVNKAIISYVTGKRTAANTQRFIDDISERVVNRPQISSDGWEPYPKAIENTFGYWANYGQIIKSYKGEPAKDAARRYSPGYVTNVARRVVSGMLQHRISTSYVERQNLTMRMQQRRFTRLTNGFSKKLENHRAAVSLYVAHYNLCRVHEALRITPAMALNVTDHIWEIGELVEAALEGVIPEPPGERHGRFRVIDGGLS